jgi:hypothetical protein
VVVKSEKFSSGCEDIRGFFNNMSRIDSRPIVGFYWVYRPSAGIKNKALMGLVFCTKRNSFFDISAGILKITIYAPYKFGCGPIRLQVYTCLYVC